MKRIALVVLLLAAVGFASAQTIEQKPENNVKIRKTSLMTRPLATIVSASIGMIDLIYETQYMLNEKVSSDFILEGGMYRDIGFYGINWGINYNLTGTYLDGLYIGAYPGISLIYQYQYHFGVNALFESGYQHVFADGFLMTCYVGYALAETSGFKFGIKAGFAF